MYLGLCVTYQQSYPQTIDRTEDNDCQGLSKKV